MNCKKCGTEVREDALFCFNCGEKIEKDETFNIENKPVNKSKTALICGIIGSVLPLIFPFVYLVLLIGIVIKVIAGSAIGYELPFVIAISVIYLPTPLALGIVAIIKSKDPNAVAKSAAKVFGVIAIVLWGLNIVLVISSLFSN
ncbi:MAG: zinc-ribbon domain-containing protein [Bacilli bacterium]|jgi:hypothetical protein